jgi:aminoglycoside/choline kinase family phosphotransferase
LGESRRVEPKLEVTVRGERVERGHEHMMPNGRVGERRTTDTHSFRGGGSVAWEHDLVTDGGGRVIPASVSDLTPEWFSSVLDTRVIAAEVEPLDEGVGFLGRTVRSRLSHSAPSAVPMSVVVKFAAEGPVGAAAAATGFYEREVRFYCEVSAEVGIAVPTCFFADIDPESGLFVLVLEDLLPARAGDQLVGATDDEIASAVSTAARLHARWWGHPEVGGYGWLPSQAQLVTGMLERASQLYGAFAEAWDGRLSDDELRLGERVLLGLGSLLGTVDHPPFTLVHGDYRLDNLFFTADNGVAVVDWQLPFRGYSGAFDLALLLASSLTPEGRNRLTSALERLYLDELARNGVAGFQKDDLRVALAVAAGQLIARCPGAHQIPSPNERGATMRARLVRGYWDIANYVGLGGFV